jgi:D-serine deaminase-like pyridoxal phosphate-dependent protein
MNPIYAIRDVSRIFSPALLFYKDLIRRNIARAIEIAGSPSRLRPHAKTHKTREIIHLELEAGITKHKCATLAEAEMLAGCGVPDILLAYPIVGPNCLRLARLAEAFPKTRFAVLADHPQGIQQLSEAMTAARQSVDVLVDIDVGMHRTGIAPDEQAAVLYEMIGRLPRVPCLRPGGIHAYDGQNNQESLAEREAAVRAQFAPVLAFRRALENLGSPVPRLVVGGTPTFSVCARLDWPELECSPGTFVLHDHGYSTRYPDLGFTPAALLLTRVISKPTANRLTLDLGYKAVASDPPAGKRCILLNVPEHQAVLQSEEHFVVETPAAGKFALGDVIYAMPTHICPTCAMHRQAHVVENGQITDRWDIVARDRILTI